MPVDPITDSSLTQAVHNNRSRQKSSEDIERNDDEMRIKEARDEESMKTEERIRAREEEQLREEERKAERDRELRELESHKGSNVDEFV